MDEYLGNSPFNPILGTNYTPSDPEIAQLREILSKPSAELAKVDDEVGELERLLEERLAQRLALNESFEKYKTLVHPLRRLPKQILQQIFVHCLPPHPHLPVLDHRTHPLTLTEVCKHWRAVALDTPQLWQGLHVVLQAGTRPFVEWYMGVVWRWLKAAKNEPVRLSICQAKAQPGGQYKPVGEELFYIFKNTILPHASHIEMLKLDSLSPNLVHLFAGSLPSTYWPMLKGVSLKWLEHAPGAAKVSRLSIWRAPLLARLEWISVDADIWATEIPWSNMKEIQVYPRSKASPSQHISFHPEAARAMVQLAASKLRTLRLSLREKKDDALPQIPLELKPVLALPHLTTLKLTDIAPDSTNTNVVFLEGLQLPSLKTLHYHLVSTTQTRPPSPDDHPLVRFLRSQHLPIVLTTFEIDINALSRRGLLVCLKLMPALDCLKIKDGRHSSRWVDASSEGGAKGVVADKALLDALLPSVQRRRGSRGAGVPECLCPRLTRLSIGHIKCDLEDVEAFVDGRLAYAKVLGTPKAPAPRLKFVGMDVTSQRLVTEGTDQEKRLRVEAAIEAKGVAASFRFSAPSTGEPKTWMSYMTFDAYSGGYELERQGIIVEEGLEDGWL